jgi:hypothetical protein
MHYVDSNQDKVFRQLISSTFISCERPIPISDSTVSKYLRIATLEALIAEEISAIIFRTIPSYKSWFKSISPAPDWDAIAKQEPLREAVLRPVSAIVYTKEQQELKETEIASIMDVIARKTRPLICDMRSFEDELRSVLQDAVDIWSLTQRSPQRIIAFLNDKTSVDSPAFDIDEGISIPAESSEGRPRASILTFPTVLVANTSKILHSGYALHASNPLIFSGTIEVEDQVSRVRRMG